MNGIEERDKHFMVKGVKEDNLKEVKLLISKYSKYPRLVNLLVNLNDMNDPCNKRTILQIACEHGFLSIVKLLVINGAKIDTVEKNGETALHYASLRGHLSVVKFLLSNGAKIDVVDSYNATPLHHATHNSHKEVMAFLIKKEANVNVITKDGETALSKAVDRFGKDSEIVKLLKSKEAV